MDKKISIIIPAYNAEKYIARCLDSVLKQDLTPSEYEILVINDGSTDSTIEILEAYSANYTQIRVITTINQGVSKARNLGCKEIRGKFFIFVDADDWIKENSLCEILNLMEADNLDLLVMDYRHFDEDGELPLTFKYSKKCINGTKVLPGKIFMQKCLPPVVWSIVYRTSFWRKHNINFLSIRHEDEELIPRVFYFAERVEFVPLDFYYYYKNTDSFMMNYQTDACFHMVSAMNSLNVFRKEFVKEPKINSFLKKIIAQKLLSSFKRGIRFNVSDAVLFDMIKRMDEKGLTLYLEKDKFIHYYFYINHPHLLINFYRRKYKKLN